MDIQKYLRRLNYELKIINDMGYAGYFLILWDFMKFCKDYRDAEHPKGIGTGTGRGSGVGSLVCRSLNITKVDPIKYELLFERFLNPERDSIPDVDLDVADLDRHLVIEYLKNKWGVDRVAQIVTFGTVKVGGGTRDLMRLKGYKKKEQDEICNKIPAKFPDQTDTDLNTLLDIAVNPDNYQKRFDDKLPGAVKMAEDFTAAINQQPWVLKQMQTLEGCVKSTGSHAGGILIFPRDGRNYAPFSKPTGAAIVPICQFEMHIIELIRALKIDVLGLTTSRIISRTANKVGIDIDNIDFEDDKVFEMLRNGFTTDVFQFSSGGMTKACIDAKVASIEDLIAIVSIYRPGPLDAKDANTGMTIYETYIEACQTGQPTKSLPQIEQILAMSKGNMIYQEQIMQVVMAMGGCSLGYADEIRRACAKKKAKMMEKLGKEFKYGKLDSNGNHILKPNGEPIISGAVNNGFTEAEADNMW
jgi:DNA polymerase-3 subunit alpha